MTVQTIWEEMNMDIQIMVIATIGFTVAAAVGIVVIFFTSKKGK